MFTYVWVAVGHHRTGGGGIRVRGPWSRTPTTRTAYWYDMEGAHFGHDLGSPSRQENLWTRLSIALSRLSGAPLPRQPWRISHRSTKPHAATVRLHGRGITCIPPAEGRFNRNKKPRPHHYAVPAVRPPWTARTWTCSGSTQRRWPSSCLRFAVAACECHSNLAFITQTLKDPEGPLKCSIHCASLARQSNRL
jgi:hypothetical protein